MDTMGVYYFERVNVQLYLYGLYEDKDWSPPPVGNNTLSVLSVGHFYRLGQAMLLAFMLLHGPYLENP